MLSQRQSEILNIIVQQFTTNGKAVGSKTMMTFGIQASSATIRNDMAKLESYGLIEKAHTSSGRVPTEAGFRQYVQTFSAKEPTAEEKMAILQTFQGEGENVAEILAHAAGILVQLTGLSVVAKPPSVANIRLISLNFCSITAHQALLIFVFSDGRILTKNVRIMDEKRRAQLSKLVELMQEKLVSLSLSEISMKLRTEFPMTLHRYLSDPSFYLGLLENIWTRALEDYLVVQGQEKLWAFSELTRMDEVNECLQQFLDGSVFATFSQKTTQKNLTILIGEELGFPQLAEMTAILAPFEINGYGRSTLLLLGPKHLNYEKIVGLLTFVRDVTSEKINEQVRYLNTK